MLAELIRAMSAAFVVGVVPGWFWAKALCAGADRAERLAYAAGLSMALVPAVALVPGRVVGLGVTLPVALLSVGVVFIGGLVAYLRFGPAQGTDEPLAPRSCASLGLPTLIPLILASALMLAVILGVVIGSWTAPLIALAVFLAGGARLLELRRRGGPSPEAPAEPPPPLAGGMPYAPLLAVLVLVLLRGYLGPMRYDWPYLRGGD